jgi:acetoin utilization deacetylase AcuC-like enzyme
LPILNFFRRNGVLPTGILIDERFLDHRNPGRHPERPERIAALLELTRGLAPERFAFLKPRPADQEELLAVHSEAYVEEIAASRDRDLTILDPDTSAGRRSYDTALLAAGGVLTLLDAVLAGEIANGFAFVRPPGHHAERDRAMGFCLFNNVAIAAEHLRRWYGILRVMILDWDVHHGNGTQAHFYDDPDALYVSLHQFPFYPGTGAAGEVGKGEAQGTTVNVPLRAGAGDPEYLDAFRRVVEPVARQFAPQFLLVSAGWDGHENDPMSGHRVSTAAYTAFARGTLALARELCDGRCVAVLEGGYTTASLAECAAAALAEFSADDEAGGPLPEPGAETPPVDEVVAIQKRFWELPA